jgi:hypothetical protein
VVRNLGRFGHSIVHLQKERYDPEKKTFIILKTWPKYTNSELNCTGKILTITNREKTILIDVESGFEKSLKGRMKYLLKMTGKILLKQEEFWMGCTYIK